MCSGRVDFSHLVRAFAKGADAVYIGGCHFGDCHYITEGNYSALGNVLLMKKILERIGINPDRLRMECTSAGEGILFAEIMNDYCKQVTDLGSLGSSEGLEPEVVRAKLAAVAKIVPFIRLVERERMRVPVKSEEAYQAFFTGEMFDKIFDETIGEKLAIGQIVSLLQEKPLTTAEIAEVINLTPSEVSKLLNASARLKFVRFDEGLKRYALA